MESLHQRSPQNRRQKKSQIRKTESMQEIIFDLKQEYQLEDIEAVIDLFKGQSMQDQSSTPEIMKIDCGEQHCGEQHCDEVDVDFDWIKTAEGV